MVVFDEHGGTYDHVPPPPAKPPDPAEPPGQYGFTFDRLGIRLPAIADLTMDRRAARSSMACTTTPR